MTPEVIDPPILFFLSLLLREERGYEAIQSSLDLSEEWSPPQHLVFEPPGLVLSLATFSSGEKK